REPPARRAGKLSRRAARGEPARGRDDALRLREVTRGPPARVVPGLLPRVARGPGREARTLRSASAALDARSARAGARARSRRGGDVVPRRRSFGAPLAPRRALSPPRRAREDAGGSRARGLPRAPLPLRDDEEPALWRARRPARGAARLA